MRRWYSVWRTPISERAVAAINGSGMGACLLLRAVVSVGITGG